MFAAARSDHQNAHCLPSVMFSRALALTRAPIRPATLDGLAAYAAPVGGWPTPLTNARRIHRLRDRPGGEAHRRGRVRARAGARRDLRLPRRSIRPATPISRSRTRTPRIDAVIWKGSWARLLFKPEEGLEVIATGRLTTFPQLVQVPDRHRADRAGRRRRADGAARGAAQEAAGRGPVRHGAQARAALPAARHRRRHLAHRRGDPRHPAPPRRPLPQPRAGLAGAGAGRHLRRRGVGRHPGLQRLSRRTARSRAPTC